MKKQNGLDFWIYCRMLYAVGLLVSSTLVALFSSLSRQFPYLNLWARLFSLFTHTMCVCCGESGASLKRKLYFHHGGLQYRSCQCQWMRMEFAIS